MTHSTHLSHRFAPPLLGALLLFSGSACAPDVSLGNYTGTEGDSEDGGATGDPSSTDTDTDTDCGAACDEDFSVAYFAAPNFTSREVRRLGAALCEGTNCPSQSDSVGDSMPCAESEEALMSSVGAEEYCRFSAVWLEIELDVAFSTPVERDSFERTRPRLDAIAIIEPYAWFPEVVAFTGPGTAYRGDITPGVNVDSDVQTSVLNEACVEQLDSQGVAWSQDTLEVLCEDTWMDQGVLRPLRMRSQMTFSPVHGKVSNTSGVSCVWPDEGPDTCCSACNYALGPNIARYGVDGSARRGVAEGTALSCDEDGDPLLQCRDLVFDVGREDGTAYSYDWAGSPGPWPLPLYDKLRETHPDARPQGLAAPGPSCTADDECEDGLGCYGTNDQGNACSTGDDCADRTCQSAWFGGCEEVAGGGHCVDARFNARGAGACFLRDDTQARLSNCDADGNGELTAQECCDPQLGSDPVCDPFEQSGVEGIDRYDRDEQLDALADCVCEDGQPDACGSVVEGWCAAPIGSGSEPGPDAEQGQYAAPVVQRVGGVRWDEELGHMKVRLANAGNADRALVEECAASVQLIGARTSADGWIANDRVIAELEEDHDLALCSGSTYRLEFAEGSAEQHVRSEAGNTLEGRSSFVFETAQFRVVPRSLFPTDNLRISSCDDFTLRFSSQLDPGPRNRGKLEIHEGGPDGPRVAGGLDCSPTATPEEIEAGAVPCLLTSVVAVVGELQFAVDESVHGQVLRPGETYTVVVPGLDTVDQMADPERYAQAMHDACGMPLILAEGVPEESRMQFMVDEACE